MDEELEALKAAYWERGVPTRWEEITPDVMAPAFRLWFRALPSPKRPVDGAEEAELLIHNPLRALRDAGIVEEREESEETPRISTMVVNHDQTLERFIMYAIVVVSTNPRTIGLTLVKEAG